MAQRGYGISLPNWPMPTESKNVTFIIVQGGRLTTNCLTDLLGMVCLANKVPKLSQSYNIKQTSFASVLHESGMNFTQKMKSNASDGVISQKQSLSSDYHTSDAYEDLELHVSGRRVAVATRVPPMCSSGKQDEDPEYQIHVYLTAHEDSNSRSQVFPTDNLADFSVGSRIPLGTITGLGTPNQL